MLSQEKHWGRSIGTLQKLDIRRRDRLGSWKEVAGWFPISNQINCLTKSGIVRASRKALGSAAKSWGLWVSRKA